MTFTDLGINEQIAEQLTTQGIHTPTEVQQLVIPEVLNGKNIVARSHTGSGKSLAYLAPLVHRMLAERGVLLVLVPTRELAQQVGRVCGGLCSENLRVAVIHGGVDYEVQRELFASPCDVIIATPGRLLDLLKQRVAKIEVLKYFVLDEVDQMVDMGFRDAIIELAGLRNSSTQSLCFSATLADDAQDVIQTIVGDATLIECKSAPLSAQQISQSAYIVEQSMMVQLLLHLWRQAKPTKSIVFCRSRKMADSITQTLKENGTKAEAIHSDRSQAARDHIMRRFTDGETELLVATDLVARGIDIDGVSLVFNFGLPQSAEQYIHRIGRTGRAGASGEATTLLCPDEQRALGEICAKMRRAIPIVSSHPYATIAVSKSLTGGTRIRKRRR